MEGRKAGFLGAFGICGSISAAAQATGVHRSTIYDWLAEDAEFADGFAKARVDLREALEGTAIRRAVLGIRKKKFNRNGTPYQHLDSETGEMVDYEEVEYSDTLLVTLLRANWAEKYGDKLTHEFRGMSDAELITEARKLLDGLESSPSTTYSDGQDEDD